MSKILIVYWSGTGNTQKMAELISQGARAGGAEVKLINVSEANPQMLQNFDVVVLGSPSMGSEEIEDSEMKPFVEAIGNSVKGKKIALFGSYGWGDGEWMRNWEEKMELFGANVLGTVIANDFPQGQSAHECISLGTRLSAS